MRRGRRRLVKIRRSLVVGCQCGGRGWGDVCNEDPYLAKRGAVGRLRAESGGGGGGARVDKHTRVERAVQDPFSGTLIAFWQRSAPPGIYAEALERPDSALSPHPPGTRSVALVYHGH